MRKLATLLCLSSLVFAAPAVQAQWQCNWLIGLEGGWMEADGNLHLSLNDLNNVTIPFSNVTKNLEHSGWNWGILGGYQARCNGWLVGLELEVDWMSNNSTTNFQFTDSNNHSWTGTGNYKRDANIGLTGRLGFQVSPCLLPYLRAGIETSRDKLSFVGATEFTAVRVVNNVDTNVNGSRRTYRGVFGVGAEIPVPMVCGLSLRAEYDYHTNGRTVSANGAASNNHTIVSASTKQNMNSVIAALVWNFL